MPVSKIGQRFREAWEASGQTQEAFAGGVGITKQALQNIFRGNTDPKASTMLRLARYTGRSLAWVYGEDEEQEDLAHAVGGGSGGRGSPVDIMAFTNEQVLRARQEALNTVSELKSMMEEVRRENAAMRSDLQHLRQQQRELGRLGDAKYMQHNRSELAPSTTDAEAKGA